MEVEMTSTKAVTEPETEDFQEGHHLWIINGISRNSFTEAV